MSSNLIEDEKESLLLEIFKESQKIENCRKPLRYLVPLKVNGPDVPTQGSATECAEKQVHVESSDEILLQNIEFLVSLFYQAVPEGINGDDSSKTTLGFEKKVKILKLLIKVINNILLSKSGDDGDSARKCLSNTESTGKHHRTISKVTAQFISRIVSDHYHKLWTNGSEVGISNHTSLSPDASSLLSTLLIFTNNFITNYQVEYDPHDGGITDMIPMLITVASAPASDVQFEDIQVDLALSILIGLCDHDLFPWILNSSADSFPLVQSVFSLQVFEHCLQNRGKKSKSRNLEKSLKCALQMMNVCIRDFKMHFDPTIHSATRFLSKEYCNDNIVVDSALLISGILQILLVISEDANGELFFDQSLGDGCNLAQNLTDLLGHCNAVLPAAVTLKNSGTNQSPADQNKHPLFKIKVDIIKVISNLSFFSKDYQNQFRGALLYVLDNCLVDDMNPFIREASLFCIRNLTDGNEDNQKIIEMLQAKSKPQLYT